MQSPRLSQLARCLLPNRSADPLDGIANLVGAALGRITADAASRQSGRRKPARRKE